MSANASCRPPADANAVGTGAPAERVEQAGPRPAGRTGSGRGSCPPTTARARTVRGATRAERVEHAAHEQPPVECHRQRAAKRRGRRTADAGAPLAPSRRLNCRKLYAKLPSRITWRRGSFLAAAASSGVSDSRKSDSPAINCLTSVEAFGAKAQMTRSSAGRGPAHVALGAISSRTCCSQLHELERPVADRIARERGERERVAPHAPEQMRRQRRERRRPARRTARENAGGTMPCTSSESRTLTESTASRSSRPTRAPTSVIGEHRRSRTCTSSAVTASTVLPSRARVDVERDAQRVGRPVPSLGEPAERSRRRRTC